MLGFSVFSIGYDNVYSSFLFFFVVQTYNNYLLKIENGVVCTLHARDKISCYETYVILCCIFDDISLSLEVKIIIYA